MTCNCFECVAEREARETEPPCEPPNICYVCKAPATHHFIHWYCDACHDAQKEKWREE